MRQTLGYSVRGKFHILDMCITLDRVWITMTGLIGHTQIQIGSHVIRLRPLSPFKGRDSTVNLPVFKQGGTSKSGVLRLQYLLRKISAGTLQAFGSGWAGNRLPGVCRSPPDQGKFVAAG